MCLPCSMVHDESVFANASLLPSTDEEIIIERDTADGQLLVSSRSSPIPTTILKIKHEEMARCGM